MMLMKRFKAFLRCSMNSLLPAHKVNSQAQINELCDHSQSSDDIKHIKHRDIMPSHKLMVTIVTEKKHQLT